MNHNNFILSPINSVLKDAVSASVGIGNGIETYPLSDYIMQSVFLKMTGAQEQKIKCICWELATNDYEYRYERFTKNKLGECSTYDEKNIIYKDLVNQIIKKDSNFLPQTSLDKRTILSQTTNSILNIFSSSNLVSWTQKNFDEFKTIWTSVRINYFANDMKNLFTATSTNQVSLQKVYKNNLYRRRNRIAHNTQSYQQNLPTLKTLIDKDYKYENYFLYFSILVLIDNILIDLYKKYIKIIKNMYY